MAKQAKKKSTPKAAKKLTIKDIQAMAKRVKNWGRWGPNDQLGTLNFVTPEDVIAAGRLIKRGQVFSLGLPFDKNGPQKGLFGNRYNPIHVMLATGTDAVSGVQDKTIGIRYADDAVMMPLQCGTQWDALGHVFYGEKMWNGYDARLVDSNGAAKNGIQETKAKMVGRGVLLDIARYKGMTCLPDGYGISNDDLDGCARKQGVKIRRGDFVLFRTGQIGDRVRSGEWGGYGGGDAPGLKFETAEWIHRKEIAAICADTWGCEVRPNESVAGINQPWHWVVIPMIGITMGEIFWMEDLAADCAKDGVYEFFFTAPPLPITGAVGSPINPQAIK